MNLAGSNRRLEKQIREFGTFTVDLEELVAWLTERGVTHVAMESTGVFWKPVFNILESHFEVLLVNARHIKQVPGRKTDVKDCEWIAKLLQHGLLKKSFIPPQAIRQLRDLTRHRAQLSGEKTRIVNRIHKVLEDANIKLGSVASDILGASGRSMIEALISGERDPEVLADLARRRLRGKIPELKKALKGGVNDHHRFQLRQLYRHVQFIEEEMHQFDDRIDEIIDSTEMDRGLSLKRARELIMGIPGYEKTGAANVIAEIGTDMAQFPGAGHLSSWTGICPGNNESAGKRRTGKTTKGNRWLRRSLTQSAWAAAGTKNTYLSARFRRLAARRGKKRALVGTGHTLLKIIYHMLKNDTPYRDLGPDYFDQLNAERLTKYYVRRLTGLGHQVTLTGTTDAA